MDTLECIKNRQSIRSFKPEPVPRELLLKIIDTARYSPSYKNTQPWEVMIVSGKKKQALSNKLLDLLEKETPPNPDLIEPTSWPQTQQNRIHQLYEKRSKATGLDLTDPAIIRKSKMANFRFYNAPHALYFYQDTSLSNWSLLDIGMFIQSVMLAATALDLGTVPQAYAVDYAPQIKALLSIPDSKRLIVGMSLGYPDRDAPVNQIRTDRADVDELIQWLE
ncbi:MAG: nitroreductase [Gammaproteobacteria bacterium]|nr:nitroreductase [Gammaproteobacteria bacterium]